MGRVTSTAKETPPVTVVTVTERVTVTIKETDSVKGSAHAKTVKETVNFPPGVDSLEKWGETVADFGKTFKGQPYKEIYETAKPTYRKFMDTNCRKGQLTAEAEDFVRYCQARDTVDGKDFCYPDSSTRRHFL